MAFDHFKKKTTSINISVIVIQGFYLYRTKRCVQLVHLSVYYKHKMHIG